MAIKTLKLKIQRDDYPSLNAAAIEANGVWNFCNETSQKQADYYRQGSPRKLLSGFDLCALTAGYTEYCEYIGADTIQRIACEFPRKLQQAKDAAFERLENAKTDEDRESARRSIARLMGGKLRWRKSFGAKRALGWMPFKAASIVLTDTGVKYMGKHFRVFERERLAELPKPEKGRPWRDGCFAQDAAGDWYLCLPVQSAEVPKVSLPGTLGIDMGLKVIAADSDGWKLPAPQYYRKAEAKLADLQRPKGTKKKDKKTRRSKRLSRAHRKVARKRRDFTHKASAKTVKRALKRGNGKILIGDVSSSKLTQTRMAKSVLDACWDAYRSQVLYKSQQAGIETQVVNERYSTQECSVCHALTGPKGLEGLKTRNWTCSACGTVHDRDTNAARVIRSREDLAPGAWASGCNGAEPRCPGARAGRRLGKLRTSGGHPSAATDSARSAPLLERGAAARRGALNRASKTGKAAP